MASAKFNKGSEEWMMFTDYWNLCQRYWIVEDTDEYWNSLVDCTNDFYEKYKNIDLSEDLAMALLNSQDKKSKKLRR